MSDNWQYCPTCGRPRDGAQAKAAQRPSSTPRRERKPVVMLSMNMLLHGESDKAICVKGAPSGRTFWIAKKLIADVAYPPGGMVTFKCPDWLVFKEGLTEFASNP